MGKTKVFVLIEMSCVALLAIASKISEECTIDEGSRITCSCVGDEEFFLPEGYNYENVTSLRLSSCVSANLHFSSLTEANRIEEIIVRNISERLIFELFLTAKMMKTIVLSGIKRIPLITHDTFTNLRSVASFRIEDTRVENFEEHFTDIVIRDFALRNVTVDRIDGLNFSEKGGTLQILGCKFQNVSGSLNFAYFSTVLILDSRFELQKPGHLLLEGDLVDVENSVFSNASMNLVATNKITMKATCADGKSSLRLSSNGIESSNNRLPTEIVYTRSDRESEYFVSRNNTVCIAGNCKCPKSNGQAAYRPLLVAFALQLCLLNFSRSVVSHDLA